MSGHFINHGWFPAHTVLTIADFEFSDQFLRRISKKIDSAVVEDVGNFSEDDIPVVAVCRTKKTFRKGAGVKKTTFTWDPTLSSKVVEKVNEEVVEKWSSDEEGEAPKTRVEGCSY